MRTFIRSFRQKSVSLSVNSRWFFCAWESRRLSLSERLKVGTRPYNSNCPNSTRGQKTKKVFLAGRRTKVKPREVLLRRAEIASLFILSLAVWQISDSFFLLFGGWETIYFLLLTWHVSSIVIRATKSEPSWSSWGCYCSPTVVQLENL